MKYKSNIQFLYDNNVKLDKLYAVSALRSAIAEVKQRWSVIG
jgi:hypothetical protein